MVDLTVEKKGGISADAIKRRIYFKQRQVLERWVVKERGAMGLRAKSGVDPEGNPLLKYSDSYVSLLKRVGESTDVDMTRTGHMLKSLSTEVKENERELIGRIFVNQSSGVAKGSNTSTTAAQKAIWTNSQRPWFGVPKRAIGELGNKIRKAIKEGLR